MCSYRTGIPVDISKAYELWRSKNASAVVSVCETDHSPVLYGKLAENNNLSGFAQCNTAKRRQGEVKYYRINGAIYIASLPEFRNDRRLYREESYGYVMSRERSVDIDTEFDFRFAEYLLQRRDADV